MTADWAMSVAIYIFKRKGNITNCDMYMGVNLLEHEIKIVEKVLEKNCNDR